VEAFNLVVLACFKGGDYKKVNFLRKKAHPPEKILATPMPILHESGGTAAAGSRGRVPCRGQGTGSKGPEAFLRQ